jgi:hypothetical protein
MSAPAQESAKKTAAHAGISSLLRFAHKISKNRRLGDFLLCKVHRTEGSRSPFIVVFLSFFTEKKTQKPTSATGS